MTAALFAVAAVSCVEEEQDTSSLPVIRLSSTEVVLNASGTAQKLIYEVENAVEGASVSVINDTEWLIVDASKSRLIEVSAEKNESKTERTSTFTVSYPDAEDVVVSVSQPAWQEPVQLAILETEDTKIRFSVLTESDEFTWVGQIVGKEWFDGKTQDDVFREDLTYYTSEAYDKNLSLEDYLKTIVNKGSYNSLEYKGLDPDSDYVLYVYGISYEGEPTTDIYSVETRTLPPYDGPMEFEVTVTETDNIMDITIAPDHDGVAYYWNIMDRTTYDGYAAECGDDPVQVFQAFVEWDIQDCLDYGDITSRTEYYEWYSDVNQVNSQFECMALTEYIVFVCKWDEECTLVGDCAYVWFTTGDVPPSSNVITVTIGDDVDQSSFFVDVQTTNNDPYVMIAEPSVFMEGMNEEQIYAHLMEDYGTWGILYYVYEGSLAGRMTGLEADTEYTMVVFGYKAGKQTTAMQKFTVRTAPAGPAEDCTFEFALNEAGSNSLDVTVTPSDAAHYYYWYAYKADMTADEVKQNITGLISSYYYNNMYNFSYDELSQGKSTGTVSFLAPETEYRIAAVVMDPDTGEFLADVIFSEPFSTGPADYADITVTAGYDKFYDGDDLYDLNPDAGAQYQGYAMVPVTISIDGDYASYYYTIFEYETGLDDPEKYPDAALYETLVYYGVYYRETANFRAPWNKAVMIAAMAIDHDGRYSRVYRQKCTFRKYNAADIEELFTKSASPQPDVVVPFRYEEQELKVVRNVSGGDDRFSAEKMAKVRRENRLRRF